MRRGSLRLANLFTPTTITRLGTIAGLLFRNVGTVPAGLQHLLTLAAAKVHLPFIAWPISSGKLLSHVGVIVRHAPTVLGIVPPVLDVSAAVDVDIASTPVDASTQKAPT